MKMKMAFFILTICSFLGCNLQKDSTPIDDYPRLTNQSLLGFDLTLNYDDFLRTYKDQVIDCYEDHVALLGQGYYTSKYKFPIKTCHLTGNLTVEFTDIVNSKYEIKFFQKDYTTQHYPYRKSLEDLGDLLSKRLTTSEPSDLNTNRDVRLISRQRLYKGILYVFSKPAWEGTQHKNIDTAELGRITYSNDQLENKIQDELKKMRDKKER